jgi:hypothetical protein
VDVSPCDFWRANEKQYPTLAALARDIFSVPATGAGVERLFNSARDVCHYRRGSLNATTIQDLMMFRCISKFDLEKEDDLILDDPILTPEERQADDERREAQFPQHTLDPISDGEEDNDDLLLDITQPIAETQSRPSMSKRPQRIASLQETEEADESDDEPDFPLPTTQQRTSGRVRKRSRKEDAEYDYY